MQERLLLLLLLFLCVTGCLRNQPRPYMDEVRDTSAKKDQVYLYERTVLPTCPLTLSEIIEIAERQNLDVLVKKLDWIIQEEVATGTSIKMLPSFTFNKEHSVRSNSPASSQQTVGSPIISPPSVSSTKTTDRWDWTLSWNLLDFGLAFYQSRAEYSSAQVQRFQYEKLKQNMILNIYQSYWKGMAALISTEHSKEVLRKARELIVILRREAAEGLISLTIALQSENQLLGVELALDYYESVYYEAKAELAALMGIPADMCFELALVEIVDMPELMPVCQMEEIALHHRPELFGADFQMDATRNLIEAEIIQMFPSLNLFRGRHTDLNPFLVHNHWIQAGYMVAWNLLNIPQHRQAAIAARTRNFQAYESRLALSIGVISQVNIAYWKYQESMEKYLTQLEIYQAQRKLADATYKQYIYGEIGSLQAVLTEGAAIQAETVLMQYYGDLQIALEQINNAMGWPLYLNTLSELENVNTQENENDETNNNNVEEEKEYA